MNAHSHPARPGSGARGAQGGRSAAPGRRLRAALLCLWLGASACAPQSPPEPGVQSLARGFAPTVEGLQRVLGRGPASPGRPSLAAEAELAIAGDGGPEDPAAVWIEARLAPDAWTDAGDGYWIADTPVGNEALGYRDDLPQRLRAGEFEFKRYQPSQGEKPNPPPGHFGSFLGNIYLRLGPAGRPPEGMHFALRIPRGAEDPTGCWRIEIGRYCGPGWPLLPGQPEAAVIELEGPRRLLFHSAAVALRGRYPVPQPDAELFGRQRDLGALLGTVVFEVRLAGETVARFEQPLTEEGTATAREVELPAHPEGFARLEIEVSGPPAWCGVLAPRLAPVAGARSRRPNVLVVLADTFRADNLSAYGSTLNLTPNLDRWAGRSLLYRRTWSAGGWTLPSQASLMTSLWPLQHRALTVDSAIPAAAQTLAEELLARGYRTGAVTDGGVISRRHDFEQGFEYFDERFRPLEDLLAAAQDFLDQDDGRPTFLYLHTYRAHHPYYASPETLARHGPRLGAATDYGYAEAALRQTGWWNHKGPLPEGLRPAMARLEGLYRAGVIDLDAELGLFLDGLEQRGWFDPGYLVFTSDHGEAFGEHDNFRHEGGAFEEQARIPLFLFGPSIAAAGKDQPASLIDIAPTILELLELPPVPDWRGRSLLGAGPGSRSLLCVAGGSEEDRPLAVIQSGQHKLLLPELDPRPVNLQAAFDLERDPREQKNRWPSQHDAVQGLFPRLERDLGQFVDEALPESRAFGGSSEALLMMLGYLSGYMLGKDPLPAPADAQAAPGAPGEAPGPGAAAPRSDGAGAPGPEAPPSQEPGAEAAGQSGPTGGAPPPSGPGSESPAVPPADPPAPAPPAAPPGSGG